MAFRSFALLPSGLVQGLKIKENTVNGNFVFEKIVSDLDDLPWDSTASQTFLALFGNDRKYLLSSFSDALIPVSSRLHRRRIFRILNEKTQEISDIPDSLEPSETLLAVVTFVDNTCFAVLLLPEISSQNWSSEFMRNREVRCSLSDLVESEMSWVFRSPTASRISLAVLVDSDETVLQFAETLRKSEISSPPVLPLSAASGPAEAGKSRDDRKFQLETRKLQKALLEKDLERVRLVEQLEMSRKNFQALSTELETTMREKLRLEHAMLETEERRLVLAQTLLDARDENLQVRESEISLRHRIKELQQELEAENQRTQELTSARDSLVSEIDRLNESASGMQAKLADALRLAEEAEEKRKILSNEILRLAENKVQLEKESRTVKEKDFEISMFKAEVEKRQGFIQTLEERVKNLESEISLARSQALEMPKLRSEISRLEQETRDTRKSLEMSEDLLTVERQTVLKMQESESSFTPCDFRLTDASNSPGDLDVALSKLVQYADDTKKLEISSRKKLRQAETAILWLQQQYVALHHRTDSRSEKDDRILAEIKASKFYDFSADSDNEKDELRRENEGLKQSIGNLQRRPQTTTSPGSESEKTTILENAVRELEKERSTLLVRATVAEEQVKALTAGLRRRRELT